MKKVLVIDGSIRKGQTKKVIERFTGMILPGWECETVRLNELGLLPCRGCALCLCKGEEYCPQKDARDVLISKMDGADCIIFASPNYSLHVTSLMKNMFDRLAFVFHRPRFFKKVFSSIVTQGVIGGKRISGYFKDVSGLWGDLYVKGPVLTLPSAAYDPSIHWTSSEQRQAERGLKDLIKGIDRVFCKNEFPGPGLIKVLIFNFTRSAHKYSKKMDRDYDLFKQMGWFSSDYYYPVKIGPFKKLSGNLAELLVKRMIKKQGQGKNQD